MARKQTLTPAGIEALVKGRLADPLTPGLWIEARESGKKTWAYRRRIVGGGSAVKQTLGTFPAYSIAAARKWAKGFNDQIEVGNDPRVVEQMAIERAKLTVAFAHERYIQAVREGRGSRAKRQNKPRTIVAKLQIYNCDIAPKLAGKLIVDVTENDLTRLVLAKGRLARIAANRLAAELKVFFGWASSLRGTEIGLTANPAARLTDLKFAEAPRKRKLSLDEIGWFLRAVAFEKRFYQRGMLLWLLTAARISEVINARSEEVWNGVWTIPDDRVKNSRPHRIALGAWGRSLMQCNGEWVFPSSRIDGPQALCGWYKARNRVLKRMSEFAGQAIEHWTPHDLRRTVRSNTKRLKIDFETAEAMLNHAKQGLERTYDGYELEDEKREWFLKWEAEIVRIAGQVGVAETLGVPASEASGCPMLAELRWLRRRPTRGHASPSTRARRPA